MRIARRLLALAAGGAAIAVAAAMFVRITLLFLFVTVGVPASGILSAMFRQPLLEGLVDPGEFELAALVLALAAPSWWVAQQRCGSRCAAMLLEGTLGLAVLAFAYRFAALLVAVAAVAVVVGGRGRSTAGRWAALGAVLLLGLVPYDVSLQLTTGAPHFAQAIEGTLAGDAPALMAKGEIVVVGGCSSWYYSPLWVWVW
jgi:hypothetical protein